MNTRSTVIAFVCLCLTAPLFAQGPQNPPSQGLLWETVNALEERIDNEGMPLGAIIMWSGTIDANGNPIIGGTPDTNWQICDGSNGTPDVRDRFVVGSGFDYFTGDVGGANSVTLAESEMPGHSHSLSGSIYSAGSHKHTISGSIHNGGSHQHGFYDSWFGGSADGGIVGERVADNYTSSHYKVTASAGYHNHTFSLYMNLTGSHTHSDNFSIGSEGSHTHSDNFNIGDTGGDSSHENRPLYYALAFIMKIQ